MKNPSLRVEPLSDPTLLRLSEALELVRSIVRDGAMTGFNCNDGDWAERLFASQAVTYDALQGLPTKVCETVPKHLLNGRDDFIVKKGLWGEFMEHLGVIRAPNQKQDQAGTACALEESENLSGHRIQTIRTKRGDEYSVNIDALAVAVSNLFSDHTNEKRRGWNLQEAWWDAELSKLKVAALSASSPPAALPPITEGDRNGAEIGKPWLTEEEMP